MTSPIPLPSSPLHFGMQTESDGKDGDENNQLQKRTYAWVDSVNKELNRILVEMTSTKSKDKSSKWSPGRICVFGRVPITNKRFNAESDVVHRRVDYCFPADLLYAGKSNDAPLSQTAVQLGALSLQAFIDQLPSFPPGNKPYRVIDISNENKSNRKYEGETASNSSSSNNNNPDFFFRNDSRPSFPRPNDNTLTYLYELKCLMKRFTTQVENLDLNDASAVFEKELHDNKRIKSKLPRKKKSRVNDDEKSLEPISAGEQEKEDKTDASTDDDKPAKEEKTKRLLRRKRFHNFSPNTLAHDYLAYRRLDRIYHRGTVRLEDSPSTGVVEEQPSAPSNESTAIVKNRPFLVFSLTGDVFLHEQARRVIGLLIAICRGVIDSEIIECMFDEEYANLVPAPPAPSCGLVAGESTYMTWEGRLKTILSPRRCDRYDKGWNEEEVVSAVELWEESLVRDVAAGWLWNGVTKDGRLNAENYWLDDVLNPWATKTRVILDDYRRWKTAKEESSAIDGTLAESLLPPVSSIDTKVPELYAKVLYHLRLADSSGNWPTTTPKRQLVMVSTSNGESQVKPLSVAMHVAKKKNDLRSDAYTFQEGEGGASGSFSVGAMPGEQCEQPKGNILFPELVKAAFELEVALCPGREPSSTIAINRNGKYFVFIADHRASTVQYVVG